MKRYIRTATLAAALAVAILATSCQSNDEQDSPVAVENIELNISTRAGGQTYSDGDITLGIDDGTTKHSLLFTSNNGSTWIYSGGASMPKILLTNGAKYPTYAYGTITTAYGSGTENIPASWCGEATAVVTDGVATFNLELTPVVARFKVTIMGSYGETGALTDAFMITPQVCMYGGNIGSPTWVIPVDPYTTARTANTSSDLLPYNYADAGGLSPAVYPGEKTITAGALLFTIDGSQDITPGTSPYKGKVFTVLAPADLTLVNGNQYEYTVRLTGGGEAVVETITVTPFDPQEPTTIDTTTP